MTQLIPAPIPHSEGVEAIASKPAINRRIFDQLAPDLQARAFVITGVEALDVVARVRELVSKLPAGGDFKELRGQILDELSPWLVTAQDPDERDKQQSAAYRRAELLLRMHGWQAYARSQHALMDEHRDVFPARMYLSSEDSRVRPTHAALNRKVLPAEHAFWLNHTPPWEFNCRCDCVPMTQDEVDEIQHREAKKAPEDKQVLPPEQLDEIQKHQRLVMPGGAGFFDLRTPREKHGSGYEWRPADDALQIDDILARFSPAERQSFEAFAAAQKLEDGRTLLQWWKIKPSAQPVLPPDPPPAAGSSQNPRIARKKKANVAGVKNRVSPVSNAIEIKTRQRTMMRDALNAIDAVHDDGVLPQIPLIGQSGNSLGFFERDWNGRPTRIAVSPSGPWPRLTAVHEMGHFLDWSAIGANGSFDSHSDSGFLARVISLLKATPTAQQIPKMTLNTDYFLSNHELWARAYAQYIAETSGNAELMADLNRVRSSAQPWRQWPASEFAPIRQEITNALQQLQWNPTPQNPNVL